MSVTVSVCRPLMQEIQLHLRQGLLVQRAMCNPHVMHLKDERGQPLRHQSWLVPQVPHSSMVCPCVDSRDASDALCCVLKQLRLCFAHGDGRTQESMQQAPAAAGKSRLLPACMLI